MQLKLYWFMIMPILIIFCVKSEKQNCAQFSISVIQTGHPITIDGDLSEPVWSSMVPLLLRDNAADTVITDPTAATQVFVCYDSVALYLGFICHDTDIFSTFTERDQHLWEDEVVEVFIDVDENPNTYVEIEVAPTNVFFDSYIVDPVNIDIEATSRFNLKAYQTAVSVKGTVNQRDDTDLSWTVEIAIPLKEIVSQYSPDLLERAEWKVNFYRIDRDADGPESYAWSPTYGRFHNPAVFGTLSFCQQAEALK